MRLLAIDDDPLILDLLSHLVGIADKHRLITASSGPEALEMLSKAVVPVVDGFLVDMQMPGMDGASVVREIRAMRPYRETPIMMLTAVSEKHFIDAAFAAGAGDYLTKPFDVVELETRLEVMEAFARRTDPQEANWTGAPGPHHINGTLNARPLQFFEPLTIFDVPNVIDMRALENYVMQLTRSSLFGSACFAFAVRRAAALFDHLSEFEFRSAVADVAEVISDTLVKRQYLMAYAGNGVFICVTESGWFPDMTQLTETVNLSLAKAEIYDNKGHRLHVRVSGGDVGRLVWRRGRSLLEALAEADASAEEAAIRHERSLKDLWSGSSATSPQGGSLTRPA